MNVLFRENIHQAIPLQSASPLWLPVQRRPILQEDLFPHWHRDGIHHIASPSYPPRPIPNPWQSIWTGLVVVLRLFKKTVPVAEDPSVLFGWPVTMLKVVPDSAPDHSPVVKWVVGVYVLAVVCWCVLPPVVRVLEGVWRRRMRRRGEGRR